jgi:hypothetical protein
LQQKFNVLPQVYLIELQLHKEKRKEENITHSICSTELGQFKFDLNFKKNIAKIKPRRINYFFLLIQFTFF